MKESERERERQQYMAMWHVILIATEAFGHIHMFFFADRGLITMKYSNYISYRHRHQIAVGLKVKNDKK